MILYISQLCLQGAHQSWQFVLGKRCVIRGVCYFLGNIVVVKSYCGLGRQRKYNIAFFVYALRIGIAAVSVALIPFAVQRNFIFVSARRQCSCEHISTVIHIRHFSDGRIRIPVCRLIGFRGQLRLKRADQNRSACRRLYR
ncbi:hypothetical protein D3C76_1290830 [compost metagenome]